MLPSDCAKTTVHTAKTVLTWATAAVNSILKDKSFMLPSDCAKTTVDTAKTVLTGATAHKSEVERFEESLLSSVDS